MARFPILGLKFRGFRLKYIIVKNKVELFIQQFLKAIRNKKIYRKTSEHIQNFIDEAYETLIDAQKEHGPVMLVINEDKMLHNASVLYEDVERITSLPLFLYRNGIRAITFLEDIMKEELEDFIELLAEKEFMGHTGLVEDIWEKKYEAILYDAVEERGEDYSFILEEEVETTDDHLSVAPLKESEDFESPMDVDEIPRIKESVKLERDNSTNLIMESIEDLLILEKNRENRRRLLNQLLKITEQLKDRAEIGLIYKAAKISLNLMKDEKNKELRKILVEINKTLRTREAAHLYLATFLNEKKPQKVKKALALLGLMEEKFIDEIIYALDKIRGRRKKNMLIEVIKRKVKSDREIIVKMLDKVSDSVFTILLNIIKELGDSYFVPYVQPYLKDRKKGDIARDVLFSILPRDKLLRYIEHPEPSIRIQAINSLKEIWGEEEFNAIKSRIESREFWTLPDEEQRELMDMLSTMNIPETVDVFRRILSKKHFFKQEIYEVKEYALEALSNMKNEKAHSLIKKYRKARIIGEKARKIMREKNGE